MKEMTGRGALITGSTRGMGAAIAEAFAQRGCDIVIHGHEPASPELLQRCRSHGVKVTALVADFTGPTEPVVDALVRQALDFCPYLDILINNAGGHQGEGDFLNVPLTLLERTLKLHVVVPYALTQRLARHWVQRGTAGCVLMMGSVNGQLAEPSSSCYDTSKAAQAMLVRTLAVELAPRNIRVNGMAPGLVLTDRTQWAVKHPERGAWVRLNTPNGQIPGPECCVGAAVFLVSPAAQHVHGQMLMIDGGISAWQFPNPPAGWETIWQRTS